MTSYLLDTHVFVWWMSNNPFLSNTARSVIQDPATEIVISSATCWEIATKVRIGKMPSPPGGVSALREDIEREGFLALSMNVEHAVLSGTLPDTHRDPFDRILIAQAIHEGLTIITKDRAIVAYDVPTLF